MKTLYNILTHLTDFHVKIIGKFNHKLGLGVNGRKQTFKILETHISKSDEVIWFHCASLGEYEQGLPVFEQIKKLYPTHKIVLSFFSPSGYEVKKNAPIANCVVYLPLDTKHNASKFLDLIHPQLVVFVKYEIWPNYLSEIVNRKTRAILISALFKKDQVFFKSYGRWMKKYLKAFEHIFVQNLSSLKLLQKHGFTKASISGDTRFDRVSNQLKTDNTLAFIDEFKNGKLCIVAGSTWPEGEKLLIDYINSYAHNNVKFIIAPHNIKPKQIAQLKSSISKKVVCFSEKEEHSLPEYEVFIIDTIGLLSKIYSYADIAYVGGGFGTSGLHNTLEPAVFGIPILIGNNYAGFPEAHEMIINKGVFSVATQQEYNTVLTNLIADKESRLSAGQNNSEYVLENKGAVTKIMAYLSS